MTARVMRPLVILAAATLGLAGCAGGSADNDSAADVAAGPLAAIFEDAFGAMGEHDAAADSRRVEESIAACMAEQGFDYTPAADAGGVVLSSDDLDVEWGSLEFAEQYGYGITTEPWGADDGYPDPGQWDDPNQAYVEAMSPAEQEAYYAALWGEQTFVDEGEDESFEYDWKEHGCQGHAQHEVYEGGLSEEFADLQSEMTALWEQIEADPQRAELDSAWAECMAEAEYSGYAAVGDPETGLYEQVNTLMEETPDMGEDADWEAWDQEVQERTKEITPHEIALAVADVTCREETDYVAKTIEIQHTHEQRFVDAHGPELEAWAEALQASRS